MSTVPPSIVNPDSKNASNEAIGQGQPARSAQHKNYKGFVAGVFSGVSKLSGKLQSENLCGRATAELILVGHPYVYYNLFLLAYEPGEYKA